LRDHADTLGNVADIFDAAAEQPKKDLFDQISPDPSRVEEIRATPSILEDVKAGRYADAALAASRKIAGWTDTVFGGPSDNKASVTERWNAPSVADLQADNPYVVAAKRTMPGLQMLSPEMIGQLPFLAVPGVAETYGVGQLAHAPEQIAHLKEEIQKKGLNLETAGDVFDTASQDALAFLPLAARTRALAAARRPTIREALKTEEPTNAETTGTQTETASSERSSELESGQEGRVRLRDDAQNRLATEPGKEAPANQRLVTDQEKLDRIRKALGQEIAVQEPALNKSLPEDSSPVAPLPPETVAKSTNGTPPIGPVAQDASRSQPETSITAGVANRILKEEADAGKIEEIQPGEGLSWEEMVDRGRSLLNEGADPQMIARRFQRNGRISADDFAVVRAERERLAVETAKAEQIARDVYNAARATETDWVRSVVQPAKTATSNIFRGMQGEAPVDVSTFAGLRKAVLDMKGRDLKPNELRPLQERATNVQRAVEAEAQGVKKLGDAIEKHLPKVEAGTLDSLRAEMTKMAEELTPCR
jgi:hypothetical protein